MSDFETKLSAMVSKELCGNHEEVGTLIERLTDALGLAVAMSSKGDANAADTLLAGIDGYLLEAVAHHRNLAIFMHQIKK